jgi:hypothetical protein
MMGRPCGPLRQHAGLRQGGGKRQLRRRCGAQHFRQHGHLRVKELEERLGARLLNRTTHKVSFTETGRAYYERCVRLLADLQGTEQDVGRHARGPERGAARQCRAELRMSSREVWQLKPRSSGSKRNRGSAANSGSGARHLAVDQAAVGTAGEADGFAGHAAAGGSSAQHRRQ